MSLSSWTRNAPVRETAVRAEIWRLGTQSLGRPLESAIDELKAPDLTSRRPSEGAIRCGAQRPKCGS
jgi:hypothetical protein